MVVWHYSTPTPSCHAMPCHAMSTRSCKTLTLKIPHVDTKLAQHPTPKTSKDVHAGNLLVLEDGRVGFIDFGIVGRIPETVWSSLRDLRREDCGWPASFSASDLPFAALCLWCIPSHASLGTVEHLFLFWRVHALFFV